MKGRKDAPQLRTVIGILTQKIFNCRTRIMRLEADKITLLSVFSVLRKEPDMTDDKPFRRTLEITDAETWELFYQLWLKSKLHEPSLTQKQMFAKMVEAWERKQAGDKPDAEVTI